MLNVWYARAALGAVFALNLSACVTLPPNNPRAPQDPWESWNRGVYKVNVKLDNAIAKPVAELMGGKAEGAPTKGAKKNKK